MELATQATSLFLLCFSYVLNKLSTKICHLLVALMSYVKIQSKNNTLNQKIYILAEDKDVFHVYTEGRNSIYVKLPCPPICVDANGYACTLLYDIMWDTFLNSNYILAQFLPYSQLLKGSTP